MLQEVYQSFWPKQNCQDAVALSTHYSEAYKDFAGNFKRSGTF